MKFKLEIDLDNSAFRVEDADGDRLEYVRDSQEIARILSGLARLVGGFNTALKNDGGKLRDQNGNTCGHWQITEEN